MGGVTFILQSVLTYKLPSSVLCFCWSIPRALLHSSASCETRVDDLESPTRLHGEHRCCTLCPFKLSCCFMHHHIAGNELPAALGAVMMLLTLLGSSTIRGLDMQLQLPPKKFVCWLFLHCFSYMYKKEGPRWPYLLQAVCISSVWLRIIKVGEDS